MPNAISIRSYTKQIRRHFHEYHQLVLPLQGSINIEVADYLGKVSLGDCVIIPAGQKHAFSAESGSRFIVVDCDELPINLLQTNNICFAISPPLLAYLQFIDKQLAHQVDSQLETLCFQLLYQLLEQQVCGKRVDNRIEAVLAFIQSDLSQQFSINRLAEIACLSPSQFKQLFKRDMQITTQKYITQLRMEKAAALLTHTDLPVGLVAEQVGYQDFSAFSRRFQLFHGQTPKAYCK